jgi:two-component sensor histidine kinase
MPGSVGSDAPRATPSAVRFQIAARICAAAVTAIGLIVLVGWALDVEAIKRVWPTMVSMKANSALLFVLLGVALLIAEDPARRALRMGLAIVITTLAVLTLLEFALATDLGIDQLLFPDPDPVQAPGRMAVATAVNFLLLGLAVAVFDVPAARRLRQAAVLVASCIAFVSACGYLFGVRSLYWGSAIHSSFAFLLAAIAFTLSPSQPLAEVLASHSVAGRMLRRLLPATVVLPVLVGELMLEWRVWPYPVEFGVAVVVLSIVLSLESVTWIVAHRLYHAEAAERQAYGALAEREHQLGDAMVRQEVLLREIHHRVKNNLAVMASLFYLESIHTADARAVALFEDSRRRIRSMALVHEMLYRCDDLASIDMAEYARILANELMTAYRPPTGSVALSTDLEPVRLGVDLAVPCGLILNELVSNAFKHAFPDGRPGTVQVAIQQSGADCIMCVTDDGVGLPADLDLDTHHSLGLRLVRLLAEQLGGTLEFQRRDPGTRIRLTFARSHDGH